jgi:ketosteroid isomerase-like protein
VAAATSDAAAAAVHFTADTVQFAATAVDGAAAMTDTSTAEFTNFTDAGATTAEDVHVTLSGAGISSTSATFAIAVFGKAWFDGPTSRKLIRNHKKIGVNS